MVKTYSVSQGGVIKAKKNTQQVEDCDFKLSASYRLPRSASRSVNLNNGGLFPTVEIV